MVNIREAKLDDLPFLLDLEEKCFEEHRRFSLAAFKRAVISPHQDVYVVSNDDVNCGSAIIHRHTHSWRLYSISIAPDQRKSGLGKQLLQFIIDDAKKQGLIQITLEADAKKAELIRWYETFGFVFVNEIPDFYGVGEPANKMVLVLKEKPHVKHALSNIVVVDQPVAWLEPIENIDVVTAEDFINDPKYQDAEDLRVFNLCSSFKYQTMGYYVSLLASARNLRAIPNVATIEDFTDKTIIESIGDEVDELIQLSLRTIKTNEFTLRILFGKTDVKKYLNLAKAIYKFFETPMFECTFEKNRHWHLVKVLPLTLNLIEVNEYTEKSAFEYFNQKRFTISRFKNYKYDLAILVDPTEPAPPSGKTALNRFKLAAEKIGFYTEFITKDDYQRVSQFDALFIRATTNVNDYTYKFSRYAYSEGLVVIDDPWSILKCSNKLYFHEAMRSEGVSTPKTVVVSKWAPSYNNIMAKIPFPIVLKRPDSASSMGVFKVTDEKGLIEKLNQLFETSELIIAQEYVRSDFDWRIGVLDNKPLFACKYFMAKNHWQIYHWDSNNSHYQVGDVETMRWENAPKAVIETALEAAAVMGDGLYGVDLKESNGKVYVIEVNDNASVDHHWEDKVLGDELYLMIMKNILSRIEAARNIKNRASQTK